MRVIGYRPQRTLAAEATIEGVGFVTGARVRVRLRPTSSDSGILFKRTDRTIAPHVPALVAHVTDTRRRTTLGTAADGVTLVEHLLATLAGLRIDNCEIEIDGPEPPGLDGSAAGYVRVIAKAGSVLQAARRPVWATSAPVTIAAGGATITLHPVEAGQQELGLRVSYLLDYGPFSPIHRQNFTVDVCPDTFVREVSACRTFVTVAEVKGLQEQGIGRHLTAADLLVFGTTGPIQNRLRYANEPARHKTLDLIGDLALCGFDLAGHVVAYRSGHSLNVELARSLATLANTSRMSSSRAA